MEAQDEEMGPELLDKLSEEWNKMSSSQPATVEFLKTSVKKEISGQNAGPYKMVAFFNPKLDINRFFLEDSDGKKAEVNEKDGADKMPNLEFGGSQGTGQMGFADNSDPFENELEEALCVFKSGDGNTDILEKNENLIMFYIDLENELIVNKQGTEENK